MKYVESRNLFGNGPTKEIPVSRAEGAPNAATEGDVGCLYMDKNTGAVYKCTAVSEDGERTWVALIDRAEIQSIVDAYNAQNPPKNGEDGGHYTPGVTQPTATTMKVEFTPSKPGMPGVEPVTVTLPERNDSGQNPPQGGLTTAQIAALDGMFRACGCAEKAPDAYEAFMEAFGISVEDIEQADNVLTIRGLATEPTQDGSVLTIA